MHYRRAYFFASTYAAFKNARTTFYQDIKLQKSWNVEFALVLCGCVQVVVVTQGREKPTTQIRAFDRKKREFTVEFSQARR